MKITEEQFESIKALVVKETGAIVSFYEKKQFAYKVEGYCTFEPFHICVCRSSDVKCFNRATITLLHEYGHIVDYLKHRDTQRIQQFFYGMPGYTPAKRTHNDSKKLTKKEKIWVLKMEWYANFYALKFLERHGFDFLIPQFNIEQTVDYRFGYLELVRGELVSRDTRRNWRSDLKHKPQLVTLKDINELTYV